MVGFTISLLPFIFVVYSFRIYIFLSTPLSSFFLFIFYVPLSLCISEYGTLLLGKAAVVPV